MTVSETGSMKDRVLRKSYPAEEGLEAGTTKQTGKRFLISEGGESLVLNKRRS